MPKTVILPFPTFTPIDTGLLSNDGITNNGLITINNLEMGATWQYSILILER
jgi:hypothetical protein